MKLPLLIIVISLYPFFAGSQNNWFIRFNTNPSMGWSNEEGAAINLITPISAMVGLEVSTKITAETGIYLNRVGFQIERDIDAVILHGEPDPTVLEGAVPVKQKFIERFIGVPVQFNYNLHARSNFKLYGYLNLTINIYSESYHKTWAYYQTPIEFTNEGTRNVDGKNKVALSYESGAFIEQRLSTGIYALGGVNFSHLFHGTEHGTKYPLNTNKIQYFKIGGMLGLRFDLKKNK